MKARRATFVERSGAERTIARATRNIHAAAMSSPESLMPRRPSGAYTTA